MVNKRKGRGRKDEPEIKLEGIPGGSNRSPPGPQRQTRRSDGGSRRVLRGRSLPSPRGAGEGHGSSSTDTDEAILKIKRKLLSRSRQMRGSLRAVDRQIEEIERLQALRDSTFQDEEGEDDHAGDDVVELVDVGSSESVVEISSDGEIGRQRNCLLTEEEPIEVVGPTDVIPVVSGSPSNDTPNKRSKGESLDRRRSGRCKQPGRDSSDGNVEQAVTEITLEDSAESSGKEDSIERDVERESDVMSGRGTRSSCPEQNKDDSKAHSRVSRGNASEQMKYDISSPNNFPRASGTPQTQRSTSFEDKFAVSLDSQKDEEEKYGDMVSKSRRTPKPPDPDISVIISDGCLNVSQDTDDSEVKLPEVQCTGKKMQEQGCSLETKTETTATALKPATLLVPTDCSEIEGALNSEHKRSRVGREALLRGMSKQHRNNEVEYAGSIDPSVVEISSDSHTESMKVPLHHSTPIRKGSSVNTRTRSRGNGGTTDKVFIDQDGDEVKPSTEQVPKLISCPNNSNSNEEGGTANFCDTSTPSNLPLEGEEPESVSAQEQRSKDQAAEPTGRPNDAENLEDHNIDDQTEGASAFDREKMALTHCEQKCIIEKRTREGDTVVTDATEQRPHDTSKKRSSNRLQRVSGGVDLAKEERRKGSRSDGYSKTRDTRLSSRSLSRSGTKSEDCPARSPEHIGNKTKPIVVEKWKSLGMPVCEKDDCQESKGHTIEDQTCGSRSPNQRSKTGEFNLEDTILPGVAQKVHGSPGLVDSETGGVLPQDKTAVEEITETMDELGRKPLQKNDRSRSTRSAKRHKGGRTGSTTESDTHETKAGKGVRRKPRGRGKSSQSLDVAEDGQLRKSGRKRAWLDDRGNEGDVESELDTDVPQRLRRKRRVTKFQNLNEFASGSGEVVSSALSTEEEEVDQVTPQLGKFKSILGHSEMQESSDRIQSVVALDQGTVGTENRKQILTPEQIIDEEAFAKPTIQGQGDGLLSPRRSRRISSSSTRGDGDAGVREAITKSHLIEDCLDDEGGGGMSSSARSLGETLGTPNIQDETEDISVQEVSAAEMYVNDSEQKEGLVSPRADGMMGSVTNVGKSGDGAKSQEAGVVPPQGRTYTEEHSIMSPRTRIDEEAAREPDAQGDGDLEKEKSSIYVNDKNLSAGSGPAEGVISPRMRGRRKAVSSHQDKGEASTAQQEQTSEVTDEADIGLMVSPTRRSGRTPRRGKVQAGINVEGNEAVSSDSLVKEPISTPSNETGSMEGGRISTFQRGTDEQEEGCGEEERSAAWQEENLAAVSKEDNESSDRMLSPRARRGKSISRSSQEGEGNQEVMMEKKKNFRASSTEEDNEPHEGMVSEAINRMSEAETQIMSPRTRGAKKNSTNSEEKGEGEGMISPKAKRQLNETEEQLLSPRFRRGRKRAGSYGEKGVNYDERDKESTMLQNNLTSASEHDKEPKVGLSSPRVESSMDETQEQITSPRTRRRKKAERQGANYNEGDKENTMLQKNLTLASELDNKPEEEIISPRTRRGRKGAGNSEKQVAGYNEGDEERTMLRKNLTSASEHGKEPGEEMISPRVRSSMDKTGEQMMPPRTRRRGRKIDSSSEEQVDCQSECDSVPGEGMQTPTMMNQSQSELHRESCGENPDCEDKKSGKVALEGPVLLTVAGHGDGQEEMSLKGSGLQGNDSEVHLPEGGEAGNTNVTSCSSKEGPTRASRKKRKPARYASGLELSDPEENQDIPDQEVTSSTSRKRKTTEKNESTSERGGDVNKAAVGRSGRRRGTADVSYLENDEREGDMDWCEVTSSTPADKRMKKGRKKGRKKGTEGASGRGRQPKGKGRRRQRTSSTDEGKGKDVKGDAEDDADDDGDGSSLRPPRGKRRRRQRINSTEEEGGKGEDVKTDAEDVANDVANDGVTVTSGHAAASPSAEEVLASLPDDQRGQFKEALEAAEEGLRTAKVFKCTSCNVMGVKTLGAMIKHLKYKCKVFKYVRPPIKADLKCSLCETICRSRPALAAHIKQSHSDVCSARDERQDELTRLGWNPVTKRFRGGRAKCPTPDCDHSFTTLNGLRYHQDRCGKERSFVIPCEHCGKMYASQSGLAHHLRTYHLPPSEKPTIEQVEDVPLGKRRGAATKAIQLLHEIAESDGMKDVAPTKLDPDVLKDMRNSKSVQALYRAPATFRVTPSQLEAWKKELNDQTCITCKFCEKQTTTVNNMNHHTRMCYKRHSANPFVCLDCKTEHPTRKKILRHLLKEHRQLVEEAMMEDSQTEQELNEVNDEPIEIDDDKSILDEVDLATPVRNRPAVYKRDVNEVKDPVKSTREFRSKLYCAQDETLFDDWVITTLDALSESDAEKYHPKTKVSAVFRTERRKGVGNVKSMTPCQTLPLYGAMQAGDSAMFFAGGPVNALAWCPLPETAKDAHEYAAVSCLPHMDYFHFVADAVPSPSLIQIWRFKVGKTVTQTPEMVFSLAHDYGIMNAIEWCPSGAYQPVSQEGSPRLGLLAVACPVGMVVVCAVPHPREERPQPTYQLAPCLKLRPMRGDRTRSGQCLCIHWSKSKGHRKIAAGFANGIVAIWNISSTSKLLNGMEDGVQCLYPTQVLCIGNVSVFSVCMNPIDDCIVTVVGSDRYIAQWDTRFPDAPLNEVWTCTGLDCDSSLLHHEAAVSTEASTYRSSTRGCSVYPFSRNTYPRIRSLTMRTAVWSISFSDWLDCIAAGSEIGQVGMNTRLFFDKRHSRKLLTNIAVEAIPPEFREYMRAQEDPPPVTDQSGSTSQIAVDVTTSQEPILPGGASVSRKQTAGLNDHRRVVAGELERPKGLDAVDSGNVGTDLRTSASQLGSPEAVGTGESSGQAGGERVLPADSGTVIAVDSGNMGTDTRVAAPHLRSSDTMETEESSTQGGDERISATGNVDPDLEVPQVTEKGRKSDEVVVGSKRQHASDSTSHLQPFEAMETEEPLGRNSVQERDGRILTTSNHVESAMNGNGGEMKGGTSDVYENLVQDTIDGIKEGQGIPFETPIGNSPQEVGSDTVIDEGRTASVGVPTQETRIGGGVRSEHEDPGEEGSLTRPEDMDVQIDRLMKLCQSSLNNLDDTITHESEPDTGPPVREKVSYHRKKCRVERDPSVVKKFCIMDEEFDIRQVVEDHKVTMEMAKAEDEGEIDITGLRSKVAAWRESYDKAAGARCIVYTDYHEQLCNSDSWRKVTVKLMPGDKDVVPPTTEYPLRAVTKVIWSPNFHSRRWLLEAGQNGIVRMIHVNFIKN